MSRGGDGAGDRNDRNRTGARRPMKSGAIACRAGEVTTGLPPPRFHFAQPPKLVRLPPRPNHSDSDSGRNDAAPTGQLSSSFA